MAELLLVISSLYFWHVFYRPFPLTGDTVHCGITPAHIAEGLAVCVTPIFLLPNITTDGCFSTFLNLTPNLFSNYRGCPGEQFHYPHPCFLCRNKPWCTMELEFVMAV